MTKRKLRRIIYNAKQIALFILTICIFTTTLFFASKFDREYDFGMETKVVQEVAR